jgi:hypothetical protein
VIEGLKIEVANPAICAASSTGSRVKSSPEVYLAFIL